MIPQTGVTSFDVCLQEVGITASTEYGLEELIDYLNTNNTMTVPYNAEDSFNELKGFIGVVGHSFWVEYRTISCANVWHFLEVYNVYKVEGYIDPDISPARWYGLEIQMVNRSVTNTETGHLYFEVRLRPDPDPMAPALYTSDLTGVMVNKSTISYVFPTNEEIVSPTYSYYQFTIGQDPLPPLTFRWRWSESLPWNDILIS